MVSCLHTQLVTVNKLQRLWEDVAGGTVSASQLPRSSGLTLVDAVDEGSPARWKLWSLLTGGAPEISAESAHNVKGLYLYGGVGAGKTMLMDLFYDALPPTVRKKRVRSGTCWRRQAAFNSLSFLFLPLTPLSFKTVRSTSTTSCLTSTVC